MHLSIVKTAGLWRPRKVIVRTFSSHAHLETLLQPAVLTLIPVMLVDGAVPVPSAGVAKIPAHATFEERFTPLARKLPVVLSRTLVTTYDALDVVRLHLRRGRSVLVWLGGAGLWGMDPHQLVISQAQT